MTEPSMSDLALGWKVSQRNVPLTDVVLKVEAYSFKVHSSLITSKSPFFAKALKGSFMEASTKIIELHDDPWIVARFVQYLYIDTYQDEYSNEQDYHRRFEGFSLRDIMDTMSNVEGFTQGLAVEQERPVVQTMMMMFNFADKYILDQLMERVTNSFSHIRHCDSLEPESVLDDILNNTTSAQLKKFAGFKTQIASFISRHHNLLKRKCLQSYCIEDPDLALRIATSCAETTEFWKSKDVARQWGKRQQSHDGW